MVCEHAALLELSFFLDSGTDVWDKVEDWWLSDYWSIDCFDFKQIHLREMEKGGQGAGYRVMTSDYGVLNMAVCGSVEQL